eukprot:934564-Prymnesium_polylepis.1
MQSEPAARTTRCAGNERPSTITSASHSSPARQSATMASGQHFAPPASTAEAAVEQRARLRGLGAACGDDWAPAGAAAGLGGTL